MVRSASTGYDSATACSRVWPVRQVLVVARRIDHRGLVTVDAELRAGVRRLRRDLERLRTENEVLHEASAPLIHQAPTRERFAFIHRLRGRFAVKRLCRIMVTDQCNYYPWTRAEARRQAHAAQERDLLGLMVEIHTAHPGYGVERITHYNQRRPHSALDCQSPASARKAWQERMSMAA